MKKGPQGFAFSGINCGIKATRRDLALVYSDAPCSAAGVFTINKVRAAPVIDASRRLPASGIQAVVMNSGNANALTGEEGLADVGAVLEAVSGALSIPPSAVLAASTGVIGVRLPAQKLVAAAPKLVQSLRPEPDNAAEAILTTDTRIKLASRQLRIGQKRVSLSAVCKGSGMMAPQLATVLALAYTDCDISPQALDVALRRAMPSSFHSLTIDGEMSTNDSVLALANGKAQNARIIGEGRELDTFSAALVDLCEELAKSIAEDGEGATKRLEVQLRGAPTEDMARDLGRAVAASPLVKASVFGADPNWGRVLATIGARAGTQQYPILPENAKVSIQGVVVYDRQLTPHDAAGLKKKMRLPVVQVEVDLRQGPGSALVHGCDLSYDYVKIAADYTSLIVQTADGGVTKDDRLANYTPAFKTSLLVEALSYISQFSGKRCVIKYSGSALVKDALRKSFCDDINLLRSVGLRPIVVHGDAPEIERALAKLGHKGEFVDGVRVTTASDLKVMEMVLSGSINSDIVTLLNQKGGHAVGISGKDGALLRARKRTTPGGADLGQEGEVVSVNKGFLDVLLGQEYVPVISPVGIGEAGQTYNLDPDAAAAEVAVAVGASKLIYVSDVPGILDGDEVISELSANELEGRLEAGAIQGHMRSRAQSILRAVRGGVERVHIIDGRTPHTVIAELFTERGVGTLVT